MASISFGPRNWQSCVTTFGLLNSDNTTSPSFRWSFSRILLRICLEFTGESSNSPTMPQCLIPSRSRRSSEHGLPVGPVNDLYDLVTVSSHTRPTLSFKPATIFMTPFALIRRMSLHHRHWRLDLNSKHISRSSPHSLLFNIL